MRSLNLGILAHVDAGKTTLTERLLYDAGVIDEVGSVDDGNTQTDSLALERRRGITIKSAVVSFAVGDVAVNLIDTPGHPDFIAEVERVLGVLDGAVLVVSAVEGVQAQTRILMRALRRLGVPVLLFVNKADRRGADPGRVLREVREKLTRSAVPMGSVRRPGTRGAEFVPYDPGEAVFREELTQSLAEHDDEILAAYADGREAPPSRLGDALVTQSRGGLVHPVYFGSAATGAGAAALADGIRELLPADEGETRGAAHGTVFKVEHADGGRRFAYVRMHSGTLRVRDRVLYGADGEGKVTGISVFEHGAAVPGGCVRAGQIGRLAGLEGLRVGEAVGHARRPAGEARHFAPPTLETVVEPCSRSDGGRLHAALTRLAEADPLIGLRQDERRGELSVSLYGEVQKEVLQATLADEYGLRVAFRESTTICIERPAGTGAAVETMHKESNPFLATVGLRVEPAPPGSGNSYRLDVELGSMPYAFMRAVEETVRDTLREGLHGWQVTDCAVTMTHSGYAPRQSHAHAVFDKSMSSTGADFRQLTPLVLMEALKRAGTVVHEPVHSFRLEIPAGSFGAVLPVLTRLRAVPGAPDPQGESYVLEGEMPAANVHALQQRIPTLTSGEGMLECAFARYQPVPGPVPGRPRTDHDPLHRKEYLLRVVRRVAGA